MNPIILGVDIGSSKICAIIAEIKEGTPQVIGVSVHKSEGVKKGNISNISQAGEIVKRAIEDAKRMAGLNFVKKAIVSISGACTQSVNSSGLINVPNNEITLKEINRVLDTALHSAHIPTGYEVIHILPYQFKLDNQDNIEDPMGMSGSRLEVSTHIVTVQRSSLENLRRTIQIAGVKIENVVLSAYAASIAVLNEDDKALGVACIDLGGGTCNMMVYGGSSMCFNNYLNVGSEHIRDDLASILEVPLGVAEYIKRQYGNLIAEESDQEIEVPDISSENKKNRLSLKLVHDIIRARVVETFDVLNRRLKQSNLQDSIRRGVVLTGGMTHVEGIRNVASVIFGNIPVRIAKPVELNGLFEELKDPTSSVAIGLILYGAGKHTNYEKDSEKVIRYKENKHTELPSAFTYTQERNYIETDLTNLKHTNEVESVKERKKDIMYPHKEVPKRGGFLERIKEWGSKLF
ncbi:cell division protein FtsA [Helicobacter suis]|uniref:cell division protein FtsA n=1 Tax=Helicobacter suis TaxID=104628 RepID=UPI00249175B9|nr:cell division protein FtsA [Helicobacter suis]